MDVLIVDVCHAQQGGSESEPPATEGGDRRFPTSGGSADVPHLAIRGIRAVLASKHARSRYLRALHCFRVCHLDSGQMRSRDGKHSKA